MSETRRILSFFLVTSLMLPMGLTTGCGEDTVDPPVNNNPSDVPPDNADADMTPPVDEPDDADETPDVPLDEPDDATDAPDDAPDTTPDMALTPEACRASNPPIGPTPDDLDGDCLPNALERMIGTDPNNPDTDWDGIDDYDEHFELCTDPLHHDSDSDGLSDFQELQLGTDPCGPDSDGDGLKDGDEVSFGFDPNKPSTFDDDVLDGERFIVTACETPASEPVEYFKSATGDWTLALPPAFTNYTELVLNNAGPQTAAAVFDDPVNEVAGYVYATAKPNGATAVNTLVGYRTRISSVGSIFQDLTEGEFDTHDSHKAAPGDYRITVTGRSAAQVRNQLMFSLSQLNAADVTGLPVASGNTHSRFAVKVTVIERDDRMVTTVSVAPEQLYDTRDQVKFRLSDLTNTTNVAGASASDELRCHPFPINVEIPAADFYWVLDQSGSMSTANATVISFATSFYAQLLNTALDFRLGVTNMDAQSAGKLRPNVGWHTDPATFSNEIQQYVIQCVGCSSNAVVDEHGLWNARQGIQYMSSSSAPLNMRLRPNAQLATIWMTDEDDQSVKDGRDPGGPTQTATQLTNDYKAFFSANPIAFSIASNASPCGANAVAYKEVALASGGAIADLCASDLTSTITQILDIVAGRASTFRLPSTPVSSSLRVYQGDPEDPSVGRWVPRSRQSGFDYFPQSNSIAFFGDYRPASGMDEGVQIAVHYQILRSRDKGPSASAESNP